MSVFVCRWPNGDCSFVLARNKSSAIKILAEESNAEGCPLMAVPRFSVHFKLTDAGELELQNFGGETEYVLNEKAYPLLSKAREDAAEDELGNPTPEGAAHIREAVLRERIRVRPKAVREPRTTLEQAVKNATGMPTILVEKLAKQVMEEQAELAAECAEAGTELPN